VILRLTVQNINSREIGDFELNASPDDWVGTLLSVLPGVSQGDACFVGAALLDPAARFAGSPLLPGAVVSVGGAGPDYHPVRGAATGTLHVIAGPDAGFGVALRPGRYFVGRAPDAHVYLPDVDVSRTHALVEVFAEGLAVISDAGSRNGTWVDGERIEAPTVLDDGSVVRLGNDALCWAPGAARTLRVRQTADGRLEFDRVTAAPPAIIAQEVDAPPPQPAPRGLAVPLLVFRGGAKRRRAIAEARAAARERLAAGVAEEERVRRLLAPGPAEVTAMAAGARPDLWSRDPVAPGGLVLRVGTTDRPPSVRLRGTPADDLPVPDLRSVPVTFDLRETGRFCVSGGGEPAAALLRWLIVQLAALRSPRDLRIVLLTADGEDPDAGLGWARWLPHLDGSGATDSRCLIGNTDASRAARLDELGKLILARIDARGSRPPARPGAGFGGDVVVVTDDLPALRNLPGMRDILQSGPEAGVYLLCAGEAGLAECRGWCELSADGLRLVTGADGEPETGVPDGMGRALAERVARALAPMRDRAPAAETAIPDPVRLLGLLGIGVPSAQDILALWSGKRPGPATRVVLGADASGPVAVDLAVQGPHTLLAGAAGAGKSVLLQTLVTGLLLANRPDELNLVLVDAADGGAFLPFQHCPHVTALIRSGGEPVAAEVRAEIDRREAMLYRYGGDIDLYWRARGLQPALPPLPRLVLIFDELADGSGISPAFLEDLVEIVGRHRPVGVHLVLATRSPRRALSPELRDAFDLRISLRQDEAADSVAVLGTPDAITIPWSPRGRGLLMSARDEPRAPRLFQSGYLGDPPAAARGGRLTVTPLAWADLGTARPAARVRGAGPTDLDLVIAAIEEAGRHTRIATRPA